MPGSCVEISDTEASGTPRSASSPHTVSHRSVLTAARPRSAVSGALLAAGLPERGSLPTDSRPPRKRLCRTHCIVPECLLSHPRGFHGGMFKLYAKPDADSLLYSLSRFEHDSHTDAGAGCWGRGGQAGMAGGSRLHKAV